MGWEYAKKSILLMLAAEASMQLKDLSSIGILYKKRFNLRKEISKTHLFLFSRFSLEIETYYTPDGGHQVSIS